MSFENEVTSLIAELNQTNPRLYQALMLLNKSVGVIDRELHPPVTPPALTPPTTSTTLLPPENFSVVSTGSTVRFTWEASLGAFQYEIRRGTDWATASFVLRTVGLQADIDPLLYGNYTYLIKSQTIGSVYSALNSEVSITIPIIGAVTIDKRVIDNNVLMSWTIPVSTFTIVKYKVNREGAFYGYVSSTFFTIFEQVPGTFTYSIAAIDIAGNEGVEQSVSVPVNSPPDFSLQDVRVSDFSGTKDDVILLSSGSLLASVILPQTWEEHFVDNSWTTIRDQIDAGYPIYAQPSDLDGFYEEIIDYGVVFANNIIVVTYNITQLGSTPVIVLVRLSVSVDGISYTPFTDGAVQFFSSFRYLKLRLEFTATDDHSLAKISNLTISLDVKRENDGGDIIADETDVGGTEIFFNKPFKDIESITVSVESVTEPYKAIYSFTDIPSPVSFFVFVFDTTGNRVTKLISWKARGIV